MKKKTKKIIQRIKDNSCEIKYFVAFVFGFIFFCSPKLSHSQYCSNNGDENSILLQGLVVDGDTFAVVQLDVIRIESEMKFANKRKKEDGTD